MRILVVQHDPDKGLGLLAAPLERAGATLDVRHAGTDRLALDGHAAVIALPGLADPPDETAAVRETRALLGDALAADLPVLGICLGAELLVEAAGGATAPCRPEFGFGPLRALPAARGDVLLAGLPSEVTAFHAHAYAVAEPLPAGAVPLAASDACLQAYRLGARAWGLQFHPEPTPEMIEGWVATVPAFRQHGVDPLEAVARARREASWWEPWTGELARGFAALSSAGSPAGAPGRARCPRSRRGPGAPPGPAAASGSCSAAAAARWDR